MTTVMLCLSARASMGIREMQIMAKDKEIKT